MFALERQKKIMESLNRDGSVLVSKLSAELGVTEETIRRDLEKLEKQENLSVGAIIICKNCGEVFQG